MGRFSIDDPMLALIARFAGCCGDLDASEDAFLRRQCCQIREFVERYPTDQRQERALEWIARNAEEYRRKWQKDLVTDQATVNRCPDCPLERQDETVTCEIHDHWLELLNRYVADGTSSQAYVEDSLLLLRQHKERLRKSILRVANS